MKAKNGVVDKHHRMDGNAIPRPRETGSRSGAMESHDSQPSQSRRHLTMTIIIIILFIERHIQRAVRGAVQHSKAGVKRNN